MPLGPAHRGVRRGRLMIERPIEPTPDPVMEKSHPDAFEKLSREPSFILFKLRAANQDSNAS